MVAVSSRDEIFSKLKEIIIEKLHVNENDITLDAKFTDDLGADSLDIIEIMMQIESEFNVEIPDEDAQKMVTLRDLVDYIADKMGITEEE